MTELAGPAGDRRMSACGGTERLAKARTVREPLRMRSAAKGGHAYDECDRGRDAPLTDVGARDTFAFG